MKIFVGNLAWSVSERDLYDNFANFGQIEDCKLITDRETGRSRGFGFITFTNDNEGQAAIEAMNGKDLNGRPVKVNEAHARPQRREKSWSREQW